MDACSSQCILFACSSTLAANVFFSRLPKVVQQHYLRCGGKSYRYLVKISCVCQQCKQFENRLRFEEVKADYKMSPFYVDTMYYNLQGSGNIVLDSGPDPIRANGRGKLIQCGLYQITLASCLFCRRQYESPECRDARSSLQ